MAVERKCGLEISSVRTVNYADYRDFQPYRYLIREFAVNFNCETCLFVKDVRRAVHANFAAEDLSEAERLVKGLNIQESDVHESSMQQELVDLRTRIIIEQCPIFGEIKRRPR